MTNEEKASQLVSGYGNCCKEECYYIAMRMAEWKDQQFKEYLENLKNVYIKDSNNLFNRGLTISSEHYNSKIECINKIINELF